MVSAEFEKLVLEKLDSLQTDVSGLKEDVGSLKHDVSGLKEDVGSLKHDVSGLKEDVGSLKHDVSGLKEDVGSLKHELVRLSVKQDMIIEQTAGLLEFQTETKSALAEIRDTQKTVIHILGEHEVEIRNIKRRAL